MPTTRDDSEEDEPEEEVEDDDDDDDGEEEEVRLVFGLALALSEWRWDCLGDPCQSILTRMYLNLSP